MKAESYNKNEKAVVYIENINRAKELSDEIKRMIINHENGSKVLQAVGALLANVDLIEVIEIVK